MKVNLKEYENKIFISKRKHEYHIYNKTTCAIIVLEENPNIYYIDFDIPERDAS